MEKNKAEEARNLLSDLDALDEILTVLEKEDNHWWNLLTPDTKRWDEDGIRMPEILRDEFKEEPMETNTLQSKT